MNVIKICQIKLIGVILQLEQREWSSEGEGAVPAQVGLAFRRRTGLVSRLIKATCLPFHGIRAVDSWMQI